MKSTLGPALLAALLAPGAAAAPPTLEEVRKEMAIPSAGDLSGQLDGVGFAAHGRADEEGLRPLRGATRAGAARASAGGRASPGRSARTTTTSTPGRVYRGVLPLVTAKTVVVVGVFHRFRRFDAKDVLVFDTYRAWRAPDGEVPVSPLREEVLGRCLRGDAIADAAMHDSEHSVETIVHWLKHLQEGRGDPPGPRPVDALGRGSRSWANASASALAAAAKARGLVLGRDLAVVVSADAVHYGADFRHVPFGDGGIDAYVKATARDVGCSARSAGRSTPRRRGPSTRRA